LVDELVLMPILGLLGARIAKRREVPRGHVPWRPMLMTAAAGLAARAAVNATVAAVPFVSAAVGATTAVALTEILGQHFDSACADPEHAHALEVRELIDLLERKTRRRTAT
jgi:hypothetical protein